jgi:2',3'-cyclic-nucleotide 2'-phosphodiesterase (5'-nucleotidase family)
MADFYNHVSISASVPGNHEFDFTQSFLENYLKKLNTNTLSANLIDNSTA